MVLALHHGHGVGDDHDRVRAEDPCRLVVPGLDVSIVDGLDWVRAQHPPLARERLVGLLRARGTDVDLERAHGGGRLDSNRVVEQVHKRGPVSTHLLVANGQLYEY